MPDRSKLGRLRVNNIGITGTKFNPLNVPRMIEECFDVMLSKSASINDPFEQAFFIMAHLPYLQPFEDVNKRVSRLAANIPLVRSNLCPLSFTGVPRTEYTKAVLSFYEFGRIEYLRDLFVWAYRRSCTRYSAVRQSIGPPDPFRTRHRDFIKMTVGSVVRSGLNKSEAVVYIRKRLPEELTDADRDRLMEAVETDLCNLHEGSIACYRLRPSEFKAWDEGWRR